MPDEITPEERWKKPLSFQPLLPRFSAFKLSTIAIVLLSLFVAAAPPAAFIGAFSLACAIECQALPWIVLFLGPFVAFGVFVALMVMLYKLAEQIPGKSARYLKLYLGVLFIAAPVLAIRYVLFRY